MLRTAFLSLIIFVSFSSSTSLLRKSISRRQTEPQYCQAIEGFDCKCSHYRVTCTTDRALPSTISVLQNEKQKYQSVELVINAESDLNVHDHTFEPVKQLYKPDAENLEFRIKFEKFTALHLSSPGTFNKVFPDNLPSSARKHVALEIYNPLVQPDDNTNLFANLNVDSLELYVLYPFRGTFQQLFSGANIKYLRLSGGDIRSELSQPFTGNVGRLEIAKQAPQLSVENFPVYPAHELIINAFYVTDFNSDHPPNYSNLGELRVHSQVPVPANAFRQYPNLHTIAITTDQNIDPHAFDGLQNLEKITIKDTKPSAELLNNLPNVKEFETSIEKLGESAQCQLLEKLASGQVAVQTIPNGHECTCASAYLDTASGRYPCNAQNCDQSSCAAIKNNYDPSTRTFKAPPAIRRSDGTDALRQREPRVYSAPFQVSHQDQEKVQHVAPQQPSGQDGEEQQRQQQQQPSGQGGEEQQRQQQQQQQQYEGVTQAGQSKKSRRTKPRTQPTTPSYDHQQNAGEHGQYHPEQPHDPSQHQQPQDPSQHQQPQDPSQHQQPQDPSQQHPYDPSQQQQHPYDPSQQQQQQHPYDPSQQQQQQHPYDPSQQQQQHPYDPSQQQQQYPYDPSQQQPPSHPYHPDPNAPQGEGNQGENPESGTPNETGENQPEGEGNENRQGGEGTGIRPEGEGTEDRQEGEGGQESSSQVDPNQSTEIGAVDGTSDASSARKGIRRWGWLPIIIIVGIIAALLLIGLVVLFIRRRRTARGYNPAATGEHGAGTTVRT